MSRWLGLPVEASAQAAGLDRLTLIVHALMAVIFVGWGVYFVYVLVRFRQSRQPRAAFRGSQSRWPTWSEAAVAIVELVLLAVLSIPAWASRVSGAPSPNDALVIRVVGQQFSWSAHYAGPDGLFGRVDASLVDATNPVGLDRSSPHGGDDVVAVNQIHVPLGRTVIVQLSSKDVVHSFGVPAMRVKQDAIPGMMIPVWFTPTLAGAYDVACSQLCGLGHYRMRAVVTVEPPEEFERWLRASGR